MSWGGIVLITAKRQCKIFETWTFFSKNQLQWQRNSVNNENAKFLSGRQKKKKNLPERQKISKFAQFFSQGTNTNHFPVFSRQLFPENQQNKFNTQEFSNVMLDLTVTKNKLNYVNIFLFFPIIYTTWRDQWRTWWDALGADTPTSECLVSFFEY